MKWFFIAIGIILLLLLAAANIAFNLSMVRPKKQKPIKDEVYIEREKIRKKNKDYLFSKNPQDMSIKTPDGLTLRGLYVPAEKPTNRFVIFSHGYKCNGPDEFSHMFPFYHDELEYNCFFPDHRGHGRSDGRYICFGAIDHKDILLWIDEFIARFGKNIEIILHGVSMGAATVMLVNEANPPEQVKLIIEDCGYTNAHEQIAITLKSIIGFKFEPLVKLCSLVCKIRAGYYFGDADCIGKMQQSKNPILFIHGDKDDFVPTEMGIRLYEACTVPKDLLLVKGAIHAYSYYTDEKAYQEKVKDFIEKYMAEPVAVI